MPAMAQSNCDEITEMQRLHSLFKDKCQEEMRLLEQITQAKLDAQQLRLRLVACGVQDHSLIPSTLRCGGHREDTSTAEIRSLIEWLARTCAFENQLIFDVGAPLQVGDRTALMGRMISWTLQGTSPLKLNVPQSLEHDIRSLLGRASRGLLDAASLQEFASHWQIIGAEVASGSSTDPTIFLIHRDSSETVVVGAWPPSQPETKVAFDPDEYFQCLSEKAQESVSPQHSRTGSTAVARQLTRSSTPSKSSNPHSSLPNGGASVSARSHSQGHGLTRSQSAGQLHP